MTTEAAAADDGDHDGRSVPAAPLVRGWIRLAIGLAQGLLLYGLHEAHDAKAWPATSPVLFGALILTFVFAPVVAIGGIGDLRRRTLITWLVPAAVLLLALGAYDVWRQATGVPGQIGIRLVSPIIIVVSAAWLFIAHHLMVGAEVARRRIAPYPLYFDAAWKNGVQLALAVAFVGVFWAVLLLGAALFNVIGIEFVGKTIAKPWFWIPATWIVFAGAVHITDVRAGITRGIRTVALALLSWLMPLLTLLAAGFLVALPFTGLKPLWETRSAAAVLLSAAAVLIVLINAAYQDGDPGRRPNVVLRWAARVAAVLLVPLVAIAGYALALRIQQYGYTPERIVAAACVLVGACYAAGYGVAAVRRGPWMKRLEPTNIATAFVILAVLLALFSPIADPGRISVADQMARLRSGKIAPDRFDYAFLRFGGGRFGVDALRPLAARPGPGVERAKAALKLENRWQAHEPAVAPKPAEITMLPKGARLPDGFVQQVWAAQEYPSHCSAPRLVECYARMVDLDGDGRDEMVFGSEYDLNVYQARPDGRWVAVGDLLGVDCQVRKDLEAGAAPVAPSPWRDLKVGDRVLRFVPKSNTPPNRVCPEP